MTAKCWFIVYGAVVIALTVATLPAGAQQRAVPPQAAERIQKEVRHELVMLPFLTVFDNLAYRVDGYNVTLLGQVTKPVLKSDAETAVKKIEGVEKVDNQIEVLPLSPRRQGTAELVPGYLCVPATAAVRVAGDQTYPDHCEERAGDAGRSGGQPGGQEYCGPSRQWRAGSVFGDEQFSGSEVRFKLRRLVREVACVGVPPSRGELHIFTTAH